MTLPDATLELPVLDLTGVAHPLRSLLPAGEQVGTLLVFLRHYGCIGCDTHLGALSPRFPELLRLGIRIALVGNGTAEHSLEFARRHRLDANRVELYADPTLATHRAFDLERSWSGVLSPRALLRALRAWGNGYRQRGIRGPNTEHGGTFLLDRDSCVHFSYRAKNLMDFAPPNEVIAQAMSLAAADHSIP